jgi:hypothetical protein
MLDILVPATVESSALATDGRELPRESSAQTHRQAPAAE